MAKKKAKKKSRVGKKKARSTSRKPSGAQTGRKSRKPAKRAAQIENTAHHEAGHAVIGMALGLSINKVTIRPGKGYLGCVVRPTVWMYEGTTRTERRMLVKDFVISSYAGFEAERRFDANALEELSQEDFDTARDLPREFDVKIRGCSEYYNKVYYQYLDRQQRRARSLVKKHWSAIHELAEALLKRKTMKADEAKKCVEKHLPAQDE